MRGQLDLAGARVQYSEQAAPTGEGEITKSVLCGVEGCRRASRRVRPAGLPADRGTGTRDTRWGTISTEQAVSVAVRLATECACGWRGDVGLRHRALCRWPPWRLVAVVAGASWPAQETLIA